MNFFQKLVAVWQKVNLVQRVLLIVIVLTGAGVAALLTYWARLPDLRMLYAQLDPEEAGKITEKIAEKNIAYELRNGGTSIYVPKDKVYQLRLDMAKDGLPTGEQGGYKLFDNEKIGISPFVQSINLKRALQDELAKSIQMIDGVIHARIHIVSSEQSVIGSSEQQTSASVVLRLRPGYRLNEQNIAAIAHLVAGSVEGLKYENVTVVDSQGRLLRGESNQETAGGAGTVQDYKERVEQTLAGKVEDMLTTVLGPGRATVKVSAEVNMTSISLVTETYDPTKKVATKEEIKSNSQTEPGAAPAQGQPAGQAGVKKDETVVTEYAVGRTVEQKADLPGEIRSLSVAAVVDLSVAEANQPAGQSAKIMELADIERLIENAVGLDLKGRDSLKVVEAKFYRPIETPDEGEKKGLDYIAIARHGSLGITAICALLVLKVFSGARKKAAAAAAPPIEQLTGTAGVAGYLPGSAAGGSETVLVRRQMAEVLRNNPEQARRLFLNWLQDNTA
jgi:flagellar M-ring protein FliF